jgi:hypothetical protein
MLAERGNQGRTPLRVGFQLKFQYRIWTPTQMKMCSQQGKKKTPTKNSAGNFITFFLPCCEVVHL